ncbi:MAG: xylulokinase [Chloroflexota bacterium]
MTLLAIDLGTSAVKVLLTEDNGRFLARASAEYPLLHPAPNQTEQNPEDWWAAIKTAVRHLTQQIDLIRHPIAAIGLSGQMHGTVLLDKNGGLLAHAIIWPDQRSQAQVQEITETIGTKRLIGIAGSPVATGFQAASLLWLRQNRPEVWSQIGKVLLPKDYIRWRLTGQFGTDPSDASGTLLFDVTKRDWSDVQLNAVGIAREQLPDVVEETAVSGPLLPQAASELGLPSDIPVIVGAADTACGLLGAGIVDAQTLLINLSTGGQIVIPATTPKSDPLGRLHTFCSASPSAKWYQMAAMLSAGLTLRWLRDNLFGMGDDKNAYTKMTDRAAGVPAGANGLLCLPYLVGERTPHMNPEARGLFLGLTASHGRAELVRAVLEGVALACYDAVSVLQTVGAKPEKIVVAGGGSRSEVWCQIIADVFNLPIQQLAVADQSALGAILLAGSGNGRFDLATTAQQWATYQPPIQPNPTNHATYQTLLPIFRAAYDKHKEDFSLLNQFNK